MTDQMITLTLPMEMVAKHTVAVGRSYSHCMNCGANYLGTKSCEGCGNAIVFAASAMWGDGVLKAVRKYAEERGLQVIGYSDGSYVQHGGGNILNEDVYTLQ